MSVAYYNEHDPFAAAWLRELIKARLIANGDVDERDIQDVHPRDLHGYTQCHFFAGIGGWSYALRLAGWPDDRPVWTGSCPCQPFSAAGKRKGTADERHLWPAFFHLISQSTPCTLFGEQVASKDGLKWFDTVQADLESAGYASWAFDLCAAGFGAPHIRQRLYFVAHAQHAEWRALVQHRQAKRNGDDAGRSEAHGQSGACGEVLGLAHSPDSRRAQAGQHGSGSSPLPPRSEQCGGNGELGNSEHSKRRAEQQENANAYGRDGFGGASDIGILGHADNTGPQRRQFSGDSPSERFAGEAGLVNGFWRDAEWLWCRDQKYRPVEPGTFPLVNGAANRVGRLRGYGNAIVPQVAQAFIEAFMETQNARSR